MCQKNIVASKRDQSISGQRRKNASDPNMIMQLDTRARAWGLVTVGGHVCRLDGTPLAKTR